MSAANGHTCNGRIALVTGALRGMGRIRGNAVAPGMVETDMSTFTKTEAGREMTVGVQALKRVGQPDDIGGAAPDSLDYEGGLILADGADLARSKTSASAVYPGAGTR